MSNPSPYLDPTHPALVNRPRTGVMSKDAAVKTMKAGGLSTDEANAVWGALGTGTPTEAQVLDAMHAYTTATSKLRDAGYSKDLVKAVGTRMVGPNPMTLQDALADVDKANPDIRAEAQDAAKAAGVTLPSTTGSPGGVQKGANGGFTPSGATGAGTVDDQYLAALRNQAKNFLSADQVKFLGSTASATALLNAIGGAGGSDEAAAAMNKLSLATGGDTGLPQEGDILAKATKVYLDPNARQADRENEWGNDGIPIGRQPHRSVVDQWTDASDPVHGAKTVAEALRMLPQMSQSELTNLQRKLVDSGYISQVGSGSQTEPDMWGDPTDPTTNAAWRQLLADSITTGKDVQDILKDRTAAFAPTLAKMQADKAEAQARQARADALASQVKVDSTDNLMAAMRKMTSGGQLIGQDLTPEEQSALAAHMQQLEAAQQTAENQGSSYVPQVDPSAEMQEEIIAGHPVQYLAQQVATSADVWKRLLTTPGGQ